MFSGSDPEVQTHYDLNSNVMMRPVWNNALKLAMPVLLCGLAVGQLRGADVDYQKQIKPILKSRCYACHGALKQESDLRLDTGALLLKGGASGLVVDFDAVTDSSILERMQSEDLDFRMPPMGEPISQDELRLFRDWIAGGAVSPSDEEAESDPRDHWAFKPPQRAPLPFALKHDGSEWPRNPIDTFLNARYKSSGLTPVRDASPAQLIRRLYLDLTGLPPTRAQLRDYLVDPTEAHFAAIADQLLDSPQYGERWGRHWMDVWRYSDWYGRRQVNDVRNSAPQIWRWRDWIVNSLNDDKSYARMIQEMLAADEIAADDDSAWPATGYLVRSYYSLNPNEWMRHNVEYTGKAFLGLTFNCAHCHAHKYDPIEHEDYFRLRAFFEPIGIRQDRVAGEKEPPPFEVYKYGGSRKAVQEGMVRIFDANPDATTWFYSGGDERNRDKERGGVEPGVPSFLNVPLPEIRTIELPMSAWYPGSRDNIQAAELSAREDAIVEAEKQHKSVLAATIDTTAAAKNLELAKAELDKAIAASRANSESGALTGSQSLFIDAAKGRRIVQNTLAGLKSLPQGTTIGFQLKILKDEHFNFQLARDTSKGLTALYLGFVKGKLKAYRPGGFQEFQLGAYDIAAGQDRFDVQLEIDPANDRALVSIAVPADNKSDNKSGAENRLLVEKIPVALNSWNPTKNAHQPFTLDCRPGTQVVIDEMRVTAGTQQMRWGFESPRFRDGTDVQGVDGWNIHAQSAAPATSLVSIMADDEASRQAHRKWQAAQAALNALTLPRQAAAKRFDADRLALLSVKATIAADNALLDTEPQPGVEQLAKSAFAAQRSAQLAEAKWGVLDAEIKLASAQALPDKDKTKQKKVAAQNKSLAEAKTRLATSEANSKSTVSVKYRKLSPTFSANSTGRRSALARWITDRTNPLTARVAVNHIWMRHFGRPIVESVYDFGRNGKPPTHPMLLDWLAVELMENDWSMKHIHRLIVTSRAYRLGSSVHGYESNLAIDKDNRLIWRREKIRMEAEVVRASVLFVSGRLKTQLGGRTLPNSQARSTYRRSLYYEVFPEVGGSIDIAQVFDAADPTECYRRAATIMPQQALALSNSDLVHQSGSLAAQSIWDSLDPQADAAFVEAAFETVLSRPPIDREKIASTRFLAKQRSVLKDEAKVRASLMRVLFNHNDYVSIR